MHNPIPSSLLNPNVGQSIFFNSFGSRVTPGSTGLGGLNGADAALQTQSFSARQAPGIPGMNGADAAIQGQSFGGRSSYNSLVVSLLLDQTAEDSLAELENINTTQSDIKDLLGAIYFELLKLNQSELEGN